MAKIRGVLDVHHLHVWRLDEQNILLESHVLIDEDDLNQMESIKSALKELLSSNFDIHYSTLEFEFEPCDDHINTPCRKFHK